MCRLIIGLNSSKRRMVIGLIFELKIALEYGAVNRWRRERGRITLTSSLRCEIAEYQNIIKDLTL